MAGTGVLAMHLAQEITYGTYQHPINTACNTPLLLIQGSDMRGWTHLIDMSICDSRWVEGEQFPRNHFNIVNAIAKSTCCHVYIYIHTVFHYISISPYIIDGNFQAYGCYDFTYGSLDWSQEVDGTLKACSLVTPIRNNYCCGGGATTSTILIACYCYNYSVWGI